MNNKRNIIRTKSISFKKERVLKKQAKKLLAEKVISNWNMTPDARYDYIKKHIPSDIATPYLDRLSKMIETRNEELYKILKILDNHKKELHETVDKEEKKWELDDESISSKVVEYAPSILWIFSILIVIYIFLLTTKTI